MLCSYIVNKSETGETSTLNFRDVIAHVNKSMKSGASLQSRSQFWITF
jgi:hypothetical protein